MLQNKINMINQTVNSFEFDHFEIRVDIDEMRILPYSIVFDLLESFNDEQLKKLIYTILINLQSKKNAYENAIDLWVDLESAGESTVLVAKSLAAEFTRYIKNKMLNIHVIINLKNKMTRDNQLFIHYLQEQSNQVVVSYSDVVKSIKIPRYDGHYLNWFTAGKLDYSLNVKNIFDYAWSCAEIGAEQIGVRVLEIGHRQTAESYLQNLYLIQIQFMRIASQYYLDAAEECRVVSEEFSEFVRLMNLTKAWGSVLSRQLDKAEHYFELAGVNVDHVPSDIDDLYRMNIFALLQHLKGRTDDAFAIELRIKDAINQLKKPRPQVTYINSINLARLYRHAGKYDEAKAHYDLAFSMDRGFKSETDYIYEKVCYGMLFEKSGKYQEALIFWLKAAIFWLLAKTPEALGWRAIRAIAQPDFKPRSYLNIDIINEAFIEKLISLAQKNKLNYISRSGISTQFILFEEMSDLVHSMVSRRQDLCVFLKKSKQITLNYENENKNMLSNIVASLLMQLLNINDKAVNTIIIDKDKL